MRRNPKVKKPKDLRSWLTAKLRRISYHWPESNEALKLSRALPGRFLCAECKKIFTRKEVSIDHIEPVVALKGFTTWDEYIARLFVNRTAYQILCKPCHVVKSTQENSKRR